MELVSLGFIPDGNRSYAQLHGISLSQAYSLGTKKALEVIDWLSAYPAIKTGTFYTLSLENLTRKKAELDVLFRIFERELEKVREGSIFDMRGIRLKFLGRLECFPKKLQEKMRSAERFTEEFKNKTVNLAIGYNGQAEIVDAAKKLAQNYGNGLVRLSEINKESFKSYLYSDFPDPDLIIRTSGTKRLSGFLTYQAAYSELHFCQHYWPDFSREDLASAVADYGTRQRRFGE